MSRDKYIEGLKNANIRGSQIVKEIAKTEDPLVIEALIIEFGNDCFDKGYKASTES